MKVQGLCLAELRFLRAEDELVEVECWLWVMYLLADHDLSQRSLVSLLV